MVIMNKHETFFRQHNVLHRSLDHLNHILELVCFDKFPRMFGHLSGFYCIDFPCTSLCRPYSKNSASSSYIQNNLFREQTKSVHNLSNFHQNNHRNTEIALIIHLAGISSNFHSKKLAIYSLSNPNNNKNNSAV